jgi:hypothetical protein
MDTVRETMNLGNLCGGKILEVADHTIGKVLANICDLSTPAEQKRQVIIKLNFEPAENRELGTVSFTCEAKLASVKPAKGNFFIARKADGSVRGYARDPKQSELFNEEKPATPRAQ